ncbi:hypothetical protein [uncultured Bacteroides sp.]|uniref:hypothetical protein n=1 Tax=uncultured Bacteroides sp. TaxID=162156 RepID=UPI002AA922C7|nr:hypothetical protein [uncultured Bacteroides sp.]
MDINITVKNIEKVLQKINLLSDIDKDKTVKEGLKSAISLFINSGKTNLRSRLKNGKGSTGNLLKSFRNKVKKNKLGALGGFSQLGNHAHLIDQGTQERYTNSGKFTGKVTGNHFWEDSINSNSDLAMNKVYDGIDRAITKIINRS